MRSDAPLPPAAARRIGPFLVALPSAPGPPPAAKGAPPFRPDPFALLRPRLRRNLESLAAVLEVVAARVPPDAVAVAAADGGGGGSASPQQPPVGRAVVLDGLLL